MAEADKEVFAHHLRPLLEFPVLHAVLQVERYALVYKGTFYYGNWIRKPGVAICICNDGLRPVIFKIKAAVEEAINDYTTVDR